MGFIDALTVWASDLYYTATTDPTKIAPTAARIAQGFAPGPMNFGAQEVNDYLHGIGASVALLQPQVTLIDSNPGGGTVWDKPADALWIEFIAVGGGGAGGATGGPGNGGGGGGGRGQMTRVRLPASAVPSQLLIVIGAAGTPTRLYSYSDGFILNAAGGLAGAAGSGSTGGSGGGTGYEAGGAGGDAGLVGVSGGVYETGLSRYVGDLAGMPGAGGAAGAPGEGGWGYGAGAGGSTDPTGGGGGGGAGGYFAEGIQASSGGVGAAVGGGVGCAIITVLRG